MAKHLLTIWDVWQYRNTIVHWPGGVNKRNLNKDIDQDIIQQFGSTCEDDLMIDDRRLIRDHTLADLQKKSIEGKRQWLRTIRNAIRSKDLDEAADNQQPEEESGQTSILQFFLPLP